MVPTNFAGLGISSTLKNLRQIISVFPTNAGSVSVVSPSRIHTQIQRWSRLLPRVAPYYAVKCNPEPFLLKTVAESGLGFDCASLREVSEVMSLPMTTDIIYAHPMKSVRDIEYVSNSTEINMTVVDSVEECVKLKACGWKGSAFLRVAVGDSESKMPFSVKFGASQKEVDEIAKHSEIPLSGVSFHVGSGCSEPRQYKDAINYSSGEVFNVLRKYGHNPTIIDIGGGFSSNFKEFEPAASIISEAIKLYVPKNRRVIAEPGRYIAQPCQDLFVKIIAKKPGLRGHGFRYVIDESLYGHFSCIPFDHQRPAWVHIPQNSSTKASNVNGTDAIVFGRTCDSLDVIAKGTMEEMEVGDWLYFPLMGAYTSATASEFNGFPKPDSILDTSNLFPDVDTAWDLVARTHEKRPVTYSNALPTII